jgi:hypothetical protein
MHSDFLKSLLGGTFQQKLHKIAKIHQVSYR